jgi:hypothetical protein
VTLRQLRVGNISVDLRVASQPDGTYGVDVLAGGDGLEVKLGRGKPHLALFQTSGLLDARQ